MFPEKVSQGFQIIKTEKGKEDHREKRLLGTRTYDEKTET
jgi:hypothetical protein